MQNNIYNKTRPENLAFLESLRRLTDEYQDIMMVGEVGEMGRRSIEIMGEYTEGSSRLHMAYSFAMLGPDFNAEHFRSCIEGFKRGAPDGHPYWSFSNHDVPRQVSRWAEHSVSEDAMARLACAMLMSFEGTIGIYQGEELGQTETEMEFEELTDPPAIRFWPTIKGRDGCRTPMVWEKDAPHAGFSSAKPWLPVKAPQAKNAMDQHGAGSILEFYKETIAFRKNSEALSRGDTMFIALPEPVLAFSRISEGQTLTCVFNLSPTAQAMSVVGAAELEYSNLVAFEGGQLTLEGNGFAYLSHSADLKVAASS
jgi:alpha-glucosidase